MFNYIYKKMHYLKIKNQESAFSPMEDTKDDNSLVDNFERNLNTFKDLLGVNTDVVIRDFLFGHNKANKSAIIYIEGITDKSVINDNIIKPIIYDLLLLPNDKEARNVSIDTIKSTLISVGNIKKSSSINNLIDSCLSGNSILLVNDSNEALIISTVGGEKRSVEEPKTEASVRGPREGFTEALKTNLSLLRRKIKSADLTFETVTIGEKTKTNVSIAYIKGIATKELIDEIKNRLNKIKIDSILESGYIEQLIEDAPFSIFSTIGNSEKPDIVSAKLLEGRAAIFVDGTPFVLTVPMVFIENFQSSEDYYSRPYFASMLRILRFFAYGLSILAPATYVILSSFHQELIPTPLLFTMAASHEGVPFPSAVEAFIMIITFEILREAGVRLPRPVGQAVSIVGALVIGESAVNAGIIGAPMVIVVAITAVSSFVVPAQTDSGAILRIILLLLAGFMGGFGILIGLLGLMVHMASLRSFGTPYLSPIAPLSIGDLKDSFIRSPLWMMNKRPKGIAFNSSKRQADDMKPKHPKKKDN